MTLAGAQEALAARRFSEALKALDDGDREGSAAWLELRAHASYGAGEYEAAVDAWERLHALHRAAGEHVAAAHAAVMTAMFLLIDAGMLSTVRGWVRRAQRQLDAVEVVTPVHALVAAVLGYERFFSGDIAVAARFASDAVRLGEQLDVMAAVAIGRTASGRIAVLGGDVDDGLSQLDEVAALLMSGDVDDLTTGMMFCELICAAQGLMRIDLAREWSDAMARWAVTGAFGGIRGRCRVHQAELLRLSGPGDAAEREALQACEELRPWMRREYGWPLVELGQARLRRGDFAGADEAFAAAGEHAWPTHPGLALLRLEQGDLQGAALQITAAIAHPVEAPSKELPPFGDLRLAPLFDAQSEIAAQTRDVATAAEAADGLRRAAARFYSPVLHATADLARARHALLTGDPQAATAAALAATTTFADLDAPFDLARSRVVLAEAYAAAGNGAAARSELTAARTGYARYGAHHRVAQIDERLGTSNAERAPAASVSAHRGTFRKDGPTWTIELGGHTARVKDLKGLRYLHRMLAAPGREFHVLDLVAVEAGTVRLAGNDGLPVLDDASRAAYRRRLADIDDDIEDASRFNDLGRIAKAEADREYLVNELARAVGIAGRERQTGGSAERARTAVARTLRYALDELAVQHRLAADHIRAGLRTGTYCSYTGDPIAGVSWTI